jgi:hypothetical protein
MKEVNYDYITVDNKLKRVDEAYKYQKTVSDKLWYNLAYNAKGYAMADADKEGFTIAPNNIEEDKYSKSEEDKKEELIDGMLTGQDNITEIFREIGATQVKLQISLGRSAREKENQQKQNNPDKGAIAEQLILDGGQAERFMVDASSEFQSRLITRLKEKPEVLFRQLGINEKTTMKQVLDMLNVKGAERQELVNRHNWDENDTIYNNFDVTPTEKEYFDEETVQEAYLNYIEDQANALLKDFMKKHPNLDLPLARITQTNNLPVTVYLDRLEFSKEAKAEFLNTYKCNPEEGIYDVFRRHLISESPNLYEEIRQELHDEYTSKKQSLVDFIVTNYSNLQINQGETDYKNTLNEQEQEFYNRGESFYHEGQEIGDSWKYQYDQMDLAKTKLEEYEDTIQNLNKMLFSGKQLESNGKRALGAIINDSDRSKDYALRNWNNQVLEEQDRKSVV